MAIYHLEAKVVSRGTGRSAVAASAYLSCSKILNDYDGVQHDYTRKKGLVWQEVFLPEFAPSEWKERGVLWNAVEENEKTKDSRLAREFVVALPIELSEAQWEKLLSDFISGTFVADGMCADVAIHDPYPPGHNPHAHIMLTVRPLTKDGKWQHKTEKEYLCVLHGRPQEPEGTYRDLLLHDRGRNKSFVVRRQRGGVKEASLSYRTLAAGEGSSLVRVRLHTGRTHQIRVHMAALGCPLAGDWLYGREDPALISRPALHSCGLRLVHPVTGEVLRLRAELPEDMKRLLEPVFTGVEHRS